jgi:hypothetical protein
MACSDERRVVARHGDWREERLNSRGIALFLVFASISRRQVVLLLRGLTLECLRSLCGCGLLLRLRTLDGSDVGCIQLLLKAVLLSLSVSRRLCEQRIERSTGRGG